MSELESLEAGSRPDLRIPPGAPDESRLHDEADGAFGPVHSYETASAVMVQAFGSCCLSRDARFGVLTADNPDSWHLKDGNSIRHST